MGSFIKKRYLLCNSKEFKRYCLQKNFCLLIIFLLFYNKIFSYIPDIIDSYNNIYIETKKVLKDNWDILVGIKYYIPILNDLKLINNFEFSYDDKGNIDIIEFEGASYRDSLNASINGLNFFYSAGFLFKEFIFNLFYSLQNTSLFCNGVNLVFFEQNIGSNILWGNELLGINLNALFIENFCINIDLWFNFYINRMNMKILIGYEYYNNNYFIIGTKFITYYKDLGFDIVYKFGIDNMVYDNIYLSLEKRIDYFIIKIWDILSILGDNIFGFRIGYLL